MSRSNIRRLSRLVARSIDPRDGRWEAEPVAYRVYFWGRAAPGMLLGSGEPMYASDEYEVTGALDVTEVLRWAEKNRKGRTFTVYAVVDEVPKDRGIVLLFGTDPTRTT
jgi:hypothetical protein